MLINFYNDKLKKLGLENYHAQFFRMNLSKTEMDKMSTEMTDNIMKTIELQNGRLFDSLQQVHSIIDEGLLYGEVKVFYPNISAMGVNTMEMKTASRTDTVWIAYLQWDTASGKIDKQ